MKSILRIYKKGARKGRAIMVEGKFAFPPRKGDYILFFGRRIKVFEVEFPVSLSSYHNRKTHKVTGFDDMLNLGECNIYAETEDKKLTDMLKEDK